jgi:hypothetical protein
MSVHEHYHLLHGIHIKTIDIYNVTSRFLDAHEVTGAPFV